MLLSLSRNYQPLGKVSSKIFASIIIIVCVQASYTNREKKMALINTQKKKKVSSSSKKQMEEDVLYYLSNAVQQALDDAGLTVLANKDRLVPTSYFEIARSINPKHKLLLEFCKIAEEMARSSDRLLAMAIWYESLILHGATQHDFEIKIPTANGLFKKINATALWVVGYKTPKLASSFMSPYAFVDTSDEESSSIEQDCPLLMTCTFPLVAGSTKPFVSTLYWYKDSTVFGFESDTKKYTLGVYDIKNLDFIEVIDMMKMIDSGVAISKINKYIKSITSNFDAFGLKQVNPL